MLGFIQDIPGELDEAGRLDGAKVWQFLCFIILPTARPILSCVAILSFIYSWNEFLFWLILASKKAVPVTFEATLFVTSYGVKCGATAAAMMLGVLPRLLLGFFAYPYIGKSMLRWAVKGKFHLLEWAFEMDDSKFGSEDNRGLGKPNKLIRYPDVFVWPPQIVAILKWLHEYILPWGIFYGALAFWGLELSEAVH